ncbi:TetR/AcrR family transcriptional regulator [uncultured Schumannella sp.]|uniref:TetR/AcrR family transcriptional regulator n=1 Tax=uncultured Schumannella sp. TaxID=1195956 RepID=UPI0025F56398|nr:TetR/AcrR family transcriptional regulator [uncultured Schumannella sp.]
MARESNPRGAGDQLRAELVAAASALLLDPQSVALPSLRAVARACSVSPAAVYLHFDSAQALTTAVLDAQLDDLEKAIRSQLPEGVPPRARLAALGRAYAGWGLAHPGAYQLVFESADRLDLPEHEHDRWSLIDEAARLVAAETTVTPDQATATALRLWTMLHGLVSLRIHKPLLPWPPVDDEIDETIARLV